MENKQNLYQSTFGSDQSNSVTPESTSPLPSPKEKKGITKKTFVLSVIFTLILSASVTSVIWFFLTNNNARTTSSIISIDNCPTEVEEKESTNSDPQVPSTTAEAEITDENTKSDLRQHLAALFFNPDVQVGETFHVGGYNASYINDVLLNGEYTDDEKLWTALIYNYLQDTSQQSISSEYVEIIYDYLYGKKPTHRSVSIEKCPSFSYDDINKIYNVNPGCGGVFLIDYEVTPIGYTDAGDKAYVETKVILTEGVATEQTIEEDRYLFTFIKNPNNNSYYFDSIEKL